MGQKWEPETCCQVIERDEREGAETPEDEGMGNAGERPLPDDLALADYFGEKLPKAMTYGTNPKIGVFLRREDSVQYFLEANPEQRQRRDH